MYDGQVKAPMVALTDALAQEFGDAKVFRPYRDVRFAKDKTPYKTHQGAFVGVAPSTGYYVEVGCRRTGRRWHLSRVGPELAPFREGMAEDGPARCSSGSSATWIEATQMAVTSSSVHRVATTRTIGGSSWCATSHCSAEEVRL